jgi:hypothetical protein
MLSKVILLTQVSCGSRGLLNNIYGYTLFILCFDDTTMFYFTINLFEQVAVRE